MIEEEDVWAYRITGIVTAFLAMVLGGATWIAIDQGDKYAMTGIIALQILCLGVCLYMLWKIRLSSPPDEE